MKFRYFLILLLTNIAIGAVVPVRSLLIVAHGGTIETLGVVVGLYAVVTVCAEIPSGIFADMHGRKLSYFIACMADIVGCAVAMMSTSLYGVAVGYGFLGLGTAFASGSINALIIEDAVATKGKAHLGKVLSAIAVAECAGIAIGSLVGGYIPNWNGYSLHLITRMFLTIIVGTIILFFVREIRGEATARPKLGDHIKKLAKVATSSKKLLCVLICVAVSSMMLVSIETYYQPQMTTFPTVTQATLGIVTALGFVGTTLGSYLLGRINVVNENKRWGLYLAFGVLAGALVITLAFMTGLVAFAMIYVMFYVLIGLNSVIEQTIVNTESSNEIRASMMSIMSFVTRIGIIPFSLISSAILIGGSIKIVWIVFAVLSIATICGIFFVIFKGKKDVVEESE